MRHTKTHERGWACQAVLSLVLLLAAAVLAVFAAQTSAAQAAEETYGRSAEDLAMEDFLANAEIVEIVDVGEGITKPKRLTLTSGDETHRAIFKDIDVQIDRPVKADRLERGFSDKYAYEVAAYRLDRLAGLGLVPVTVVREVEGEVGSVQLWIEDVITLETAVNDPNADVANYDLLVERLGLMYVLDVLIYNVDRNFGNVLVDLDRDIFHPIDHSRAFRLSPKPPPSVHGQTDSLVVPSSVEEKLKAFDLETLELLFGDLLEKRQVRAIIKRRDRLIKILDALPA
ncbi:MAG: hypothetical protein GY719_02550 [bacterium]|nr:hypothetical protein [bacterium]